MTRSRLRTRVVLAGLFLLVSPSLAPLAPPAVVVPLSLLRFASAGFLLYAGFVVYRTWIGTAGAGILVALMAATPIVVTAIPVAPETALRLPCPRNWGWLPAWMLRPSPLASLSFSVGETRVKVCYGRPASRGRRMLGGRYVPYGQLWRTGANEPTTIISTGPLEIAGIPVPGGRHSLYAVPGPESWEIIVNTSTSQWGLESEYTEAVKSGELGRAILPSQLTGAPVERLLLTVQPSEGSGKVRELILEWESTRLRIPVAASPSR